MTWGNSGDSHVPYSKWILPYGNNSYPKPNHITLALKPKSFNGLI